MGHKRKAAVLEDDPERVGGSSGTASSAPTFKRTRKVAPKMVVATKELFLKSKPHVLGLRVQRTFKSV
jgi:hypothetical protein